MLRAAALASAPAGPDPVDRAIVQAGHARGCHDGELTRIQFKAFAPVTKRAKAFYRAATFQEHLHFMKGAPAVVAKLAGTPESLWQKPAEAIIASGQRVLAVAQGDNAGVKLVGLIGLEDTVRADSKAVVEAISKAGVRVIMITGDNALAARSVAEQVGIPPAVCPLVKLQREELSEVLEFCVFAGVFPEDKFKLVRAFQRTGAVVGMSGDGVNDAPTLRQAEADVAVANATDVAKTSAAMVLTEPGLGGLVAAISTSRRVFQRVITYTLNVLTKKSRSWHCWSSASY